MVHPIKITVAAILGCHIPARYDSKTGPERVIWLFLRINLSTDLTVKRSHALNWYSYGPLLK